MKTFKKYVEIARAMRTANSFALDIRELTPNEAYIVAGLVKSDAIFNFFNEFKDTDVRALIAGVKLLEYKEAYEKYTGRRVRI